MSNTLCLAPWTHTYLSPQGERRMCCASREPAQNFKQYIDTKAGSGKYIPITLEEHWNSAHMQSVRQRMIAGETLPECEVCNDKLLNTDVYRTYFWQLFKHKYDKISSTTDASGATTMLPVSWDYRFSNLCNFKCRMCGDMLSSSWETEQRQHNMIDWSNPKNNWMLPEIRKEIGYLPSEIFYYDKMKVIDLLKYSASFYDKDCDERIYELAEIMELDLERKIQDLSYGNKKKVGIVQGLLHSPKLLILDEPTSGLDPLMQQKFFHLISEENKKGVTVLFSSHILSEVQQLCNRVAIIKDGEIISIQDVKALKDDTYKKFTFKCLQVHKSHLCKLMSVSLWLCLQIHSLTA